MSGLKVEPPLQVSDGYPSDLDALLKSGGQPFQLLESREDIKMNEPLFRQRWHRRVRDAFYPLLGRTNLGDVGLLILMQRSKVNGGGANYLLHSCQSHVGVDGELHVRHSGVDCHIHILEELENGPQTLGDMTQLV